MVNTFTVFDVGAEKRFIQYTAWPFSSWFEPPPMGDLYVCPRRNCVACTLRADGRYEQTVLDRWADDGGPA